MAEVASSRARWGRRALLIFGAIVGVLALTYGILFATTGNSQLSRALVWLDVDVGDIDKFPAREIATSTASDLPTALDNSAADAFSRIDLAMGGGIDQMFSPRVDLDTFLQETDTNAFLVVKDGVLVSEWYAEGIERETLQTSFSVSKSFLSTLIGLAIDDGSIGSLDDPITDYIPELLERDPGFADITLRNLVTMSSGLAWEDTMTPWGDPAKTYYAPDLRASGLSSMVEEAPGHTWEYNNYNPLLLGMALERATGQTVSDYMSQVLWAPLGAEGEASWSLDSVNSGFEKMESGFNARAVDFARFGLMFANDGAVDGVQVVPEQWVQDATAVDATGDPADHYQYFWWVYQLDPNAPPDVKADFAAQGNLGQYIYVAPNENIVLVRLGASEAEIPWTWLMGSLAREMYAPAGMLPPP